jgi:hypothetical protein
MKKIFSFIVLITLVFQPGLGASPSKAAQGSQSDEPASQKAPIASESPDLPGWPMPDKPVPHHEPGHLSKASSYTSQVQRLNPEGLLETVQLNGMDAMAADDVDPFSGNYTMVSYDQLLRSAWSNNNFSQETVAISGTTMTGIQGDPRNLGNYPSNDVAAGDFNADGQSEQVVAWMGAQNHIYLSTGEMPGMPGKTTSAPAAVARGGSPPDGYALELDGVDDYVDAGSGINLANASFTVAFWAKRESIDRHDFVVGQGVGSLNIGLHIGFRSNNTFTCAFYANDLNTPEAYTDSDWHHWACTYDAGTKLRTIYRDGIQVAQNFATANYQGSGDLYIGREPTGNHFKGLIDQVGIWGAARSSDQIRLDAIRFAPDQTDLIAYWPFDEGTGTSTADASGNGHDGTLVNGPLWNPENAPEGELHLLARGYDQALWHCIYVVSSGSCLSWNEDAGGGLLLSAPAVVSRGAGQFDVFAVLSDNQVYQRHWSEAELWSGSWTLVDGSAYWPSPQKVVPVPELPAPAVVSRGGEQLDLFRLGPDNTLRWRHYDGNAWEDWQNLEGMLASGPGVVSLSANHMQVFARGVDEALWTITYNGSWGNWQRLELDGMPAGTTLASAPAVVSPASGQIVVYVRGSDGQLWSIQYNGNVWGIWSASGGELASGPGAAVFSGVTYLYAQKTDDLLQSSQDGINWEDLGGLPPCCTIQDMGLIAQRKNVGNYYDNTLDIETGYFWGDGRSQTVLGYYSATNQVAIALFDISDSPDDLGFTPEWVATWPVSHSVDWFRLTTGDFLDQDGQDDIAIAYTSGTTLGVDILKFSRTSRQLSVATSKTIGVNNFEGSLDITSGDFDADGQDEIAVSSVTYYNDWDVYQHCDTWRYISRMRIYDVDKILVNGVITDELKAYFVENYDDKEVDNHGNVSQVSLALAAGDVNGDGKDEIVRTWPDHFDNGSFGCGFPVHTSFPYADRFNRTLQVIELPLNADVNKNTWSTTGGDISGETVKNVSTLGATYNSYGDRLAIGDFDRDMFGEIVWQVGDNSPAQNLHAYKYDPGSQTYPQFATKNQAWGYYPHLVAGAFTGESLRVGPPSYRVQNRVDTLVAMINMPPVHRDIIKDGNGNNVLVETPKEECVPSVDSPNCTHAKYGKLDFSESQELIETKHAYTVSAGMEQKACASGGVGPVVNMEACVTRSIDYTHGGTFDSQTDNISSITYSSKVIAADDDKIVYYGTPYAVWEYPILANEPGETPGYITVVSPLISETSTPTFLGGYYNPTCDENWYAAGHQPNNVWSYDPIGAITFKDYDPAGEVYNPGGLDDWFENAITYETFKKTTDSTTFSHSIKAGLELEVNAKADLKVYKAEGNFKAYIKGSYDNSQMETDSFTTKDGTTFSFFLSPKPLDAKYTTRPILYWANAGHIVLDYQAEPGQGATWLMYNKPDPAFILPWYGFPDPQAPEVPPCGGEKKLFSHDVTIDPPVVSAGEPVTITAVVRNFSNVTGKDVKVRFCQGDPGTACNPANGSAFIGEKIIPTLSRPNGPKAVSINWTASGVGKQKIYAVIDPDRKFDEMHDEDDPINNNVAYGLVEIGAATYFDMGQAVEKTYESQSYTQTQSLKVSVYVPLANLSAITRFDLKDVNQRVHGIGNPFELLAYQGEVDWGTPEDEDFYLTQPGSKDPPAVIAIHYEDADIANQNEGSLKLYRLGSDGWEEANRTCGVGTNDAPIYLSQLFPEDNLIAVPVCQAGTFVLAAGAPISALYLPIVTRR